MSLTFALGHSQQRHTPRTRSSFSTLRRLSGPWLLLCLALLALAVPSGAWAQKLEPIPALSFSTTFGQDLPLSQLITVSSTAASFTFTAAASTTTGGAWLTITPSAYGYGVSTPYAITVNAKPAVTLAAGTYTGQIVVTPVTNTIPAMTIPVTLVVHAVSDTYFDQVAGGLTFTELTGGLNPPGQALQIRNAGVGNLAWTATTSTADGGAWLTLSAASGTAPSVLKVSVVSANLPGAGLISGTFTGQIVLKTTGDTETIPITMIVGPNVFRQINPLNFTKTYAGANPLSQVITMASTGTQFTFTASTQASTGGSWLTITPSAYGYGLSTPQTITIGVNPAITLAAGTYMSEVIVNSVDHTKGFSIPVTLTVEPTTTDYFDAISGALDYSMLTAGGAPPAQELLIRNAGTGTLAWTTTSSTADGGAWLTLSAAGGTAPDSLSVSVNPANLPGAGLVAGTFVGQVVLQSATGNVTVPVSFTVGAAAFAQLNPLSFVKTYGGPNPLPQVITVASTGANFTFNAVTVNSTGGSWLSISPSAYGYGISTPQAITVSVNPDVTLAAGTYSSEIVITSETGAEVMTVPVTLSIEAPTATYFDNLPGGLSFSMLTKGNPPPAQVLPIRNAGAGSLAWSATTNTADGGAWLDISTASGTAPSYPTVSVVPANLPGSGLVAGTFTGQVILVENGNPITVPVTMTVGANVFRQVNPLIFTMVAGGANPLPQVITVASTGTNLTFLASAVSSTGGTWLSVTPSAYGYGISTPEAVVVTATPAATLAAGTYSSEIVIKSADGTQSMTVPVTLNVLARTAPFFDALPGQLSFSMVTSGTKPPAIPIEIRNAGTGSLAWTATRSTSDGGAWLTISSASGTAPSAPLVSVVPTSLPGGGLVAGTFTGQIILTGSTGDRVTIPVSMVVGASVFRQVNPLDFNMTYSGAHPLPQVVNITSTGTAFTFIASVANSTGGNWLNISPSAYGYGLSTPQQLIVSVNPAATLAAGTYTAQIIATAAAGSPSMVIPVTLTVNPATANYFDDMPGSVSFFQATGTANPAPQIIPIRNAGLGTLDWTAKASTSDGGAWLTLSAASGTAPSSLTVTLNSANMPGKGLVAGIYNGQVVLLAGTGRETVPVQVVVGASVFTPLAPLSFAKAYSGSNPASQTLSLASTSANFTVLGLGASANGGNWLTISPSAYGYGISTPTTVTVSVNPATTLAPGFYVAEVIFTSTGGDQGMVVPVTLTVDSTTATATPTFTPPGGSYTSTQTVTIADGTRGAAIYYTTDGTTPTTASKVYSAPISVTTTGTVLKAIAIAPGYPQSAVATATYTITSPPAATPLPTMTVAISEATTGATVYYTTNGTTPTTASTVYTGPIMFTVSTTLKFIAVAPNYAQSSVRTVMVTVQ